MNKIIKYLPFGWLADFGHGIILSFLIPYLFNLEYSLNFLFLGILFSILPDTDALGSLIKNKSVSSDSENIKDHRDGIHYPILWFLVGIIFIYINPFWGTFFLSCIFMHFVNDSWGTGWGVKWLWPLNNRNYKFFSDKNIDAYVGFKNFIVSWSPQEKEEAIKKLGNPNWIKDNYLSVTPISVIEIGIFIFAIILFLMLF